MTTIARCCFANLALSAKVHRYLDTVAAASAHRHMQRVEDFDSELRKALPSVVAQKPAGDTLQDVKRDFEELEKIYAECKQASPLPPLVADRFDRLVESIRLKIEEKESPAEP